MPPARARSTGPTPAASTTWSLNAAGVPPAAIVTGGHRRDVTQLIPLVEAIPPLCRRRGRPLRRPRSLLADRADDHQAHRRALAAGGITSIIARRGTPHSSGLGRQRWPIECTFGWLHQFHRVRPRWERRDDLHQTLLSLACSLIYLHKREESL